MTVLDLLDELEEMIDATPKLPLTGKVMVDASEIMELSRSIKLSLPDDVQQAKWIKDEKERILAEAKNEYERIIIEAKKHADTMVEKDVITERAVNVSGEIYRRADEYSKGMRLKTYDYMDNILYNFREKIDELSQVYMKGLYQDINDQFAEILSKVDGDLAEIRTMTDEVQNTEIRPHDIDIPLGDDYDD